MPQIILDWVYIRLFKRDYLENQIRTRNSENTPTIKNNKSKTGKEKLVSKSEKQNQNERRNRVDGGNRTQVLISSDEYDDTGIRGRESEK